MTSNHRIRLARFHNGHYRRSRLVLFIVFAFLLAFPPSLASQQTGSTARVRVSIEMLDLHDCDDVTTTPDPYVRVTVDGASLNPENNEIDYYESPIYPNQDYSTYVDLAQNSVNIEIALYDDDDPWSDDDHCDIFSGAGNNLALRLDLNTCAITGDMTSQCNVYLTSDGVGDDAASIGFRVIVDDQRAPNMLVRCTHRPVAPQPGQPVTITAEALREDMSALTVNQLEIYVDPLTTPVRQVTNANITDFIVTPSGSVFSYYCRAAMNTSAETVTTWHTVPVGAHGPVIPVLYTTDNLSNALDVIFIADTNTYPTGASSTQFLTAVMNNIRFGFYGETHFLSAQAAMNFWIATETTTVNATNRCSFDDPDHWESTYGFANVGVILSNGGGCAHGGTRLFSTAANATNVARHEVGHVPFGLADEYGTGGGSSCYFEPDPYPNIYETEGGCHDDLADLDRIGSTCRRFQVNYQPGCDGPGYWWTSEPAVNDLMNDNGIPQAADIRRIEYYFTRCGSGSC